MISVALTLILLLALNAYAQEPVKDVKVNKQPFVDLQRAITELQVKKQLDLETAFEVAVSGTLDRKGKIDPSTLKYLRIESSKPDLLNVVKQGIEAINESGFFQYLSELGVKVIQIDVKQDDQTFSFVLESAFPTDSRAKSLESLLTLFLQVKKQRIERKEDTTTDPDELFLIQNAKSQASGKIWKFGFSAPKAEFWKMLDRTFTVQKITQQGSDAILINKKPLQN